MTDRALWAGLRIVAVGISVAWILIAILDAGLARTKGAAAADVQSHLGWAHWLNQHIAERVVEP